MNAERAPFDRRGLAVFIGQRGVPRGAERHQRREQCGAAQIDRVRQEEPPTRAEACPGFEVSADEQRHARQFLHRIQLHRHLHRTADGHREATHLIRFDPGAEP